MRRRSADTDTLGRHCVRSQCLPSRAGYTAPLRPAREPHTVCPPRMHGPSTDTPARNAPSHTCAKRIHICILLPKQGSPRPPSRGPGPQRRTPLSPHAHAAPSQAGLCPSRPAHEAPPAAQAVSTARSRSPIARCRLAPLPIDSRRPAAHCSAMHYIAASGHMPRPLSHLRRCRAPTCPAICCAIRQSLPMQCGWCVASVANAIVPYAATAEPGCHWCRPPDCAVARVPPYLPIHSNTLNGLLHMHINILTLIRSHSSA